MSGPRKPEKFACQLAVRMDAALLQDVGLTAYRLGIERSEVVRRAATLFAQVVDDAWYLAQIGADPSPSMERLVEAIRDAMATEIAATLPLIIQGGNRATAIVS